MKQLKEYTAVRRDTALLCDCEICTPYSPQGVCAPMQPIGWCIRCGKPETIEQVESLNEQTRIFFNDSRKQIKR